MPPLTCIECRDEEQALPKRGSRATSLIFSVLMFASAISLGVASLYQVTKREPTNFASWDDFQAHNRKLQTQDASLGNSYAIYGTKVESRIVPDAKTMAKNCFSGLNMRQCDIRQAYRESAGEGWLYDESAGLNFIADSCGRDENGNPNRPCEGREEYCLSCCSNSRLEAEIDEVWDLVCDAGSTHQFTKISEQLYCSEFRFLRNQYLGSKDILYCRIERFGEKWDPPRCLNWDLETSGRCWTGDTILENTDYEYTVRPGVEKSAFHKGQGRDGTARDYCYREGGEWKGYHGVVPIASFAREEECIPNLDFSKYAAYGDTCLAPELNRDDKSAFRGYTLELTVEEMTDGFKFWRQVHDCKVTVDEELHVPMRQEHLWNPNRENRVYERIVMRSPDELTPYKAPVIFILLMLFLCFCCCCQGLKYWRDDPCRVCHTRLIFRRKVCFWCKFYKAVPPKERFYKEWQKEDLEKRDNFEDTSNGSFFEQVEQFIERGWKQVVWGTTRDEDQYELESWDMDVGYRRRFPNKKMIVPSELFEKDTGITVVQTTLFDKFGNQEVYPSFSPGSPAREAYNMKTRFNLKYLEEAREAHLKGELEPAFKHSGNLMLTQAHSPESDDGMCIEDMDEYERKQKKKEKKMRKKESTKKLIFADEEEGFGGVKQIKFGVSIDVKPNTPDGGTFRPSAATKPAKSALKSSLKRGGRVSLKTPKVGFGGVRDDEGGKDGSDDFDFGVDFDALADRAAGEAAAKLGYTEDPEEKRENDRKLQEAEQRAIEARMRAKEDENNVRKAGERKKAGMQMNFSAQKLLEHTQVDRQQFAEKKKGGLFGRNHQSRWSKVAAQINEDTKDNYLEKLRKEPKNFLALQRLGCISKKEADDEIASNPIYAFQLYRCAALALQKSVDMRGAAEVKKDQDFPWKDLAEAHLRTWLLQGIRGDRHHLDLSCDAWGHASRQLINMSDPRCLVHFASSMQFVGNYKAAAQILGEVIVNFPNYTKLNAVCFQASIILKSLHNFKQAAAYLEKVLSLGPPPPYTSVDLIFVMGRIFQEWSEEEDGNYEQTSHKAFMKVMMALKTEEVLPSLTGFDDWIGDAITWCSLAEKCAAAGHYALASDFFSESIKRYEDEDHHAPLAQLWFELSKCRARAGKMEQANRALERALQIDPEDEMMVNVWTEWEDPNHVFEMQRKLPIKKFVAKLAELLPQK